MPPQEFPNFEDLDLVKTPLFTNLTRPNSGEWIKSLSFAANVIKFSYQTQQNNRVIESLEKDKFLVADFSRLRFSDRKIGTNYIIRILTKGIIIDNNHYNYLGQSNSHLKDRKCLLYQADPPEIQKILNRFGDWTKFNNVAKLAKRIGLLFSSGDKVFNLPSDNNKIIDDVERDGHCFTDGCGFASKEILKKVAKTLKLTFRENRYCPSVIQIRYQGFKGILVLGTHLSGMSCEFRKSMNKFTYRGPNDFFVVGHSKPYTFGRLNTQTIMLLSSLGVPDDKFIKKQDEHFERLNSMFTNLSIAFEHLLTTANYESDPSQLELAGELVENGYTEKVLKSLRESYKKELVSSLKEKKGPGDDVIKEEKLRIVVKDSRLVFAAPDPTSKLADNECFFRPTIQNKPTTITGPIFCVRNPCYHAGDVVILNAVHLPECEDIIDVILFSVNGEVPAAHRSAGGDLDGDKFFVCWDPDLMPVEEVESYSYPGNKEKITRNIQRLDVIKNFANQSNAGIARCSSTFSKWADAKGPRCNECIETNKLFSSAVDGGNVMIPDYLTKVPEVDEEIIKNRIWNKLVNIAMEKRKNTVAHQKKDYDLLIMDKEELHTFLEENSSEATDYELLNFLIRWCRTNNTSITEFFYYLDFTSFTAYEKIQAIAIVPPRILFNAIHMSRILDPNHICHFKLGEEEYHWKLFHSSYSQINGENRISFSSTLVADLVKAVTNFRRVFAILRFDHELTICISLHGNFMPESENDVDNKIIVYGLNQSESIMKKKSCLNNYKLFYSEGHFQLYISNIANTFIWLGAPRKLTTRATTLNELEIESRVSIAIDKLCKQTARKTSRINKMVISESEIYVVSNRDGILTRYQVVNPDYVPEKEVIDIDADYNPLDPLNPENDADKKLLLLSPIHEPTDDLKELKKRLECWARYGAYDKCIKACDMFIKRNSSISVIQELVDFSVRNPIVHAPLTAFVSKNHPPDLQSITLVRMIETCMKAVNNSKEPLVMENVMRLLNCPVTLSMYQILKIVTNFIINYPDTKMAQDYWEELFYLLEKKKEDEEEDPIYSAAFTHFLRQVKSLSIQTLEEFLSTKKTASANRYRARKTTKANRFTLIPVGPNSVRVRPGDLLMLKRLNKKSNEPISMIRALVISTERQVNVEVSWTPRDIEVATWKVKNVGNTIGFRQSMDAIKALYPTKDEEISIILSPLLEPENFITTVPDDSINNQQLNLSQRKAVYKAENGNLTLWQGPAGTGKTKSIFQLILSLLSRKPSQPILVTAATNAAVDNIARLLDKHDEEIKTIRIGDINSVLPELHHITLEAGLEGARINSKKSQQLLKEAKVICATCVGSGASLLEKFEFDFVIVDEASQVSEPICLIPLSKKCERFALVGDHKQLRPFCLPKAIEAGYDISLFERMYNKSYPVCLLDTQYRMHPGISQFPNQHFYDGRLFDGIVAEDRPIVEGFEWPNKKIPVAFFPVIGSESSANGSKYNQKEVNGIFNVVKKIVASGMKQEDIGIISLYSAQLEKMKELLGTDSSVRDIEVKTADGFQGREKELILITCVRCNENGMIGFLEDEHRFNVMLTRAKRGLIVFGNRQTLISNEMWQAWFKWIDDNKLSLNRPFTIVSE